MFNFYQQAIKVLQISLTSCSLFLNSFKAGLELSSFQAGLVLIVTLDVSGGCILYPMYFIKIPPFCPREFYNSSPVRALEIII